VAIDAQTIPSDRWQKMISASIRRDKVVAEASNAL
jgi:hypothetical protein